MCLGAREEITRALLEYKANAGNSCIQIIVTTITVN